MRNTFIETLTVAAGTDERLFLICGDLGYSVLEPFAQRFPDRFLNAGIAEQNMVGMAAGLSREGYNVFVYSIGNFPTLRAMEQIRYDVCYHGASVKIVAVGGGYAYGPLGVSHHTTEDLAMLRVLPGMTVAAPADPVEARAVALWMAQSAGPGYVRINKSGESPIHMSPIVFSQPRGLVLREGRGTVVLSTGAILESVMKLEKVKSGDWGVVSMPFVKPLDTDLLASLAGHYTRMVTVEEHQRAGGFGSAVLEALHDLRDSGAIPDIPQVIRKGIPDIFLGYAGSQEYLRSQAIPLEDL